MLSAGAVLAHPRSFASESEPFSATQGKLLVDLVTACLCSLLLVCRTNKSQGTLWGLLC